MQKVTQCWLVKWVLGINEVSNVTYPTFKGAPFDQAVGNKVKR